MVAETLPVQLDQAAAVSRFLVAHALENRRRGGEKISLQTLREIRIDAFVLFLERDGKGENLAFGKTVEASHTIFTVTPPCRLASTHVKLKSTQETRNSGAEECKAVQARTAAYVSYACLPKRTKIAC